MKKFKEYLRVYKYVVYDIATIILSYYLTIWIYFGDGTTFPYSHRALWLALIFIIPGKLVLFALLGIYKIMSRHASFEDFFRIVLVVTGSNLLLLLITLFIERPFIDERAFVLVTFIEVTGILFPRILRRSMEVVNYKVKTLKNFGDKTLIIGAGSAGEMALKEMVKNDKLTNIPVAFLDDNPEKLGKQIMGVSVVGTLDDLDKVIKKLDIQEVILAIKELPKHQYHVLVNKLVEQHIRVKKLNVIEDVKSSETALVDLKIEDLLNRPVINLDNQGISDFIKDEIVLVTGGGGSIGSELSRQIFDLKPKQLIIFDIYENNAYDIQMELERKVYKDKAHEYPELHLRIGSVYNKKRLEEIFQEFKPTIVFHAAAYKHVPLMEDSAVESVRTNVLGTYNATKLSTKYHVKKFVLVSSDKAVRSTNIMGASKRFAELIIMNEQKVSKTSFTAVRFGNVLGSNGSVIPLFKKQIEDGGPVTVTHKEITRYFMTIPESVSLILQCGAFAKNGELFILDMGEPVKIYEFAEKMIRLAGYRVDEDIKIEVIGLRPGEKLYEELLFDTNNPNIHKTENKLIFIENGNGNDLDMKLVDDLLNNLDNLENEEVKLKVSNIVKSYKQNTI